MSLPSKLLVKDPDTGGSADFIRRGSRDGSEHQRGGLQCFVLGAARIHRIIHGVNAGGFKGGIVSQLRRLKIGEVLKDGQKEQKG